MSASEELRSFIPYGNCITGASAVYFAEIDQGRPTDKSVALAKAACQTCVQLTYCQEQRPAITDELWARGVHAAMIGGDMVVQDSVARDAQVPTEPLLRFDLTQVVGDAPRRLAVLRQAIRTKQLSIESRPPLNVKIIAHHCMERLKVRAPDLVQAFAAALDTAQQEKALRYMVISLCQQADYESFSTGQRSSTKGAANPRYQPERFDFDTHIDTVQLFMQEALEIAAMGYADCGRVAIYHSPEFCRRLKDQFMQVMGKGTFFNFVRNYVIEPQAAMQGYLARLQLERLRGGPARGENDRKVRARVLGGPKRGGRQVDPPEDFTARVAYATATYGPDHPIVDNRIIDHFARRPLTYLDDIERFVANVTAVTERYGDDPDFTPGTVRHLARAHGVRTLRYAREYRDRLALWRTWAASAPTKTNVTDKFLRELALRGDVAGFDDIERAHTIKDLQLRFRARNRRRVQREQPAVPIEAWMLNRVAALYPHERVSNAANNLFDFLDHGFLVSAVAELSELQSSSLVDVFATICDPRTKRYMTFASALVALTDVEMRAMAHVYDLSLLLYGGEVDENELAMHLGVSDMRTHVERVLYRQCRELVASCAAKPAARPVVLDFEQDLIRLKGCVVASGPQIRAVVVGGQEVQMALQAQPTLSTVPVAHRDWLADRVNAVYPPSEQTAAYQAIISSVQNGVLEVQSTDTGFVLTLQGSANDLSEVERAAVAYVAGAGRLMYSGRDIGLQLRSRFETDNLRSYVEQHLHPRLRQWHDIDAALDIVRCTPYALSVTLAFYGAKPHQLRYIDGAVVGVEPTLVARIAARSYPLAPPGWVSHRLLMQTQDAAKVLKRIIIREQDRTLARSASTGILDVYYAQKLAEQVRQFSDTTL